MVGVGAGVGVGVRLCGACSAVAASLIAHGLGPKKEVKARRSSLRLVGWSSAMSTRRLGANCGSGSGVGVGAGVAPASTSASLLVHAPSLAISRLKRKAVPGERSADQGDSTCSVEPRQLMSWCVRKRPRPRPPWLLYL